MVTISPSPPLSLHPLLPQSIKTLILTLSPDLSKPKPNLKLITRRDASAALLSALVLPQILQPLALAAGPTVSECELTATPSGLGFCDRVVGTGAAASKGQLIKVHFLYSFFFFFHLCPHK